MEEIVTRMNFRELREKHRISVYDVAKRAGLSKSTVTRFETCDGHSYVGASPVMEKTSKVLINSLQELVSETGTSSTIDILRKYCEENGMYKTEFCIMCDISRNSLTRVGKGLRKDALEKVAKAIGVSVSDIKTGKILEKENKDMSHICTKKTMEALKVEELPVRQKVSYSEYSEPKVHLPKHEVSEIPVRPLRKAPSDNDAYQAYLVLLGYLQTQDKTPKFISDALNTLYRCAEENV